MFSIREKKELTIQSLVCEAMINGYSKTCDKINEHWLNNLDKERNKIGLKIDYSAYI